MSAPQRVRAPYSEKFLTAKYLKAHRLAAGLSPTQLGQKAGVGRRAISHLENGDRGRIAVVARLARALNMTLQALRRTDVLKQPPGAVA